MALPFYIRIMDLAYNLILSAFIAILLSYLVAKLMPLVLSGGEAGGEKVLNSGVDNGDKQKGPAPIGGVSGVKEGNLDKKLKLKGSKSKKKRVKKISAETVVVSEFKGKSEPSVSAEILGGLSEAGDSVDDSRFFCGIQKEDDCSGLNGPLKNDDRLIEEGLDLKTNQGNDSEKLIEFDDRIDCRECYAYVIGIGTATIESKKDEKADAQDELDVQNEDMGLELTDGEEWEGIERNELEKDFARAMDYVESMKKGGRLNRIGSDVIMQFHDLEQVAMEGPCQKPKISARSKWNSWQKSESLNSDEAMEQYITLLSDKVPGWDSHPSVESKLVSEKDDTFRPTYNALDIPLTVSLACTNESKPGEKSFTGTGYVNGRSSSVNKDGE